MWRWRLFALAFAVHFYTISSQPLNEDSVRDVRDTKQLDIPEKECCPCPKDDDAPLQGSAARSTGTVDDCPCRSRDHDSVSAASDNVPSQMRSFGSFLSPSEEDNDPKPLLHPEVDLATSLAETLRDATEQEYKEAVERAVARTALKSTESQMRDSGNPTNSVVAIILDPTMNADMDVDTGTQETRVQETRCLPVENNPERSALTTTDTDAEKPSLLKNIFTPLQLNTQNLFRNSNNRLFQDSDIAASNFQERNENPLIDLKKLTTFNIRPLSLPPLQMKSNLKIPRLSSFFDQFNDQLTKKITFNNPTTIEQSLTGMNLREDLEETNENRNQVDNCIVEDSDSAGAENIEQIVDSPLISNKNSLQFKNSNNVVDDTIGNKPGNSVFNSKLGGIGKFSNAAKLDLANKIRENNKKVTDFIRNTVEPKTSITISPITDSFVKTFNEKKDVQSTKPENSERDFTPVTSDKINNLRQAQETVSNLANIDEKDLNTIGSNMKQHVNDLITQATNSKSINDDFTPNENLFVKNTSNNNLSFQDIENMSNSLLKSSLKKDNCVESNLEKARSDSEFDDSDDIPNDIFITDNSDDGNILPTDIFVPDVDDEDIPTDIFVPNDSEDDNMLSPDIITSDFNDNEDFIETEMFIPDDSNSEGFIPTDEFISDNRDSDNFMFLDTQVPQDFNHEMSEESKSMLNMDTMKANTDQEKENKETVDEKVCVLNGESNVSEQEMSSQASEPVGTRVLSSLLPKPLEQLKSKKVANPSQRNEILQPDSLTIRGNDQESENSSPFAVNSIFNNNLRLPTLDEIRARMQNLLNGGSLIDPSATSPFTRFNGLPTLPNIRDDLFRSSITNPLNVNLDVFRVKPFSQKLPIPASLTSGLNMDTFRANLPPIQPLGLKPIRLESSMGKKGNLIGATLTFNPDKTSNTYNLIPSKNKPALKYSLRSPTVNKQGLKSNFKLGATQKQAELTANSGLLSNNKFDSSKLQSQKRLTQMLNNADTRNLMNTRVVEPINSHIKTIDKATKNVVLDALEKLGVSSSNEPKIFKPQNFKTSEVITNNKKSKTGTNFAKPLSNKNVNTATDQINAVNRQRLKSFSNLLRQPKDQFKSKNINLKLRDDEEALKPLNNLKFKNTFVKTSGTDPVQTLNTRRKTSKKPNTVPKSWTVNPNELKILRTSEMVPRFPVKIENNKANLKPTSRNNKITGSAVAVSNDNSRLKNTKETLNYKHNGRLRVGNNLSNGNQQVISEPNLKLIRPSSPIRLPNINTPKLSESTLRTGSMSQKGLLRDLQGAYDTPTPKIIVPTKLKSSINPNDFQNMHIDDKTQSTDINKIQNKDEINSNTQLPSHQKESTLVNRLRENMKSHREKLRTATKSSGVVNNVNKENHLERTVSSSESDMDNAASEIDPVVTKNENNDSSSSLTEIEKSLMDRIRKIIESTFARFSQQNENLKIDEVQSKNNKADSSESTSNVDDDNAVSESNNQNTINHITTPTSSLLSKFNESRKKSISSLLDIPQARSDVVVHSDNSSIRDETESPVSHSEMYNVTEKHISEDINVSNVDVNVDSKGNAENTTPKSILERIKDSLKAPVRINTFNIPTEENTKDLETDMESSASDNVFTGEMADVTEKNVSEDVNVSYVDVNVDSEVNAENTTPKSILERIRDSLKGPVRINTFNIPTEENTKDLETDMERSASDNVPTSLSKPLQENVSYKCKIICTRDE